MLPIGARLRRLREVKRMSQGDVERRAGQLRCYISRVENGHTVPTLEPCNALLRRWMSPCTSFFTPANKGRPTPG